MVHTRLLLTVMVALSWPIEALGQAHPFEGVGGRAQGMAGAFVAVADDATAVFWNPAGLASGQPFGADVEWNWQRPERPNDLAGAGPRLGSSTFTSLGTWPIGLSFGRRVTSQLVVGPADGLQVETLETRDYGVTILQTLAPGLVIGSTLRYVRGSTNFGPAEGLTVSDSLERAAAVERNSSGAFDLDVGVMADIEYVRVGIAVKNLREPEFGDMAENAIKLRRHARLGIAVLPATGVTLAMDLDLNTVDLRGGLRRMIAFGGESRLGSRLAVRSGVQWNRESVVRRLVTTAGVSVAVRSGLWLDGHYAYGRDADDRAFGVALRAGY